MKAKHIFSLLAAVVSLFMLDACRKDYTKDSPFENVVYIDAAQVKELSQFTFNNVTETGSRSLAAVMAYPNNADVEVKIEVAPSLVSTYSARLGGARSEALQSFRDFSAHPCGTVAVQKHQGQFCGPEGART